MRELPRLAELLTHALAAIFAFQRTRPGRAAFAPGIRPVFWFLLLTLLADGARWAIQAKVLRHAPRPFEGTPRLLFHVDQAGVVGWNAGLVMLAYLAFGSVQTPLRTRRLVVGTSVAWLGATCALALAYPALRGESLGDAYAVVHLVTTVLVIALAVRAWRKDAWFGAGPRAVSVLIVGEAATLLGPFLGEPFRYWTTANVISACVYILLAWELRRPRLVSS